MSTPSPLTVLVVDDSAVFRATVRAVLESMPSITVLGIARDGVEAVEAIATLKPDVVTLDVEMPNRDGVETLREIRRRGLKTDVIMLSSLTHAGAAVTMEALFEGAFDFVPKPTGGLVAGREGLTTALTDKFNALRRHRWTRRSAESRMALSSDATTDSTDDSNDGDHSNVDTRSVTTPPRTSYRLPPQRPHRPSPAIGPRPSAELTRRDSPDVAGTSSKQPSDLATSSRCRIVVIAASTGGPLALRRVIPGLADIAVPVLIVQHMPAGYVASMASRLSTEDVAVVRAEATMRLARGRVYAAPGDYHLVINRVAGGEHQFDLNQDPPRRGCRPAADITLNSAVQQFGGGVLAVVLTGMGRDGLEGCQNVKQAGGSVFVQDAVTAAVDGMPRVVREAGIADRVLPIGRIAPAIMRHVRRTRRMQP